MFIGPYEHHSNELPWRESVADVVVIDEDADGHVDLADLERAAAGTPTGRCKIGSFSAASNVTGIVSDTIAIATLLHEHGALSFWDFAAAAPYVRWGAKPRRRRRPQGRDLPVAAQVHRRPGHAGRARRPRHLFRNRCPRSPAAAPSRTSALGHHYLVDPVAREEGGTPANRRVDPRRAGLPAQGGRRRRRNPGPRGAFTAPRDRLVEPARTSRSSATNGLAAAQSSPSSSATAARTSTTTSSSRCSTICSASRRAAAARAPGPTGTGCSASASTRRTRSSDEIRRGCEGVKPGWVRVNFNYFIVGAAVPVRPRRGRAVAADGYRLLPLYRFDSRPGSGGTPRRPAAGDAAV